MPCRKHIKRPSKFSFVTLDPEAKDRTWLKLHSGAARSHAAYWGGSARYRRKSMGEAAEEARDTLPPSSGKCKVLVSSVKSGSPDYDNSSVPTVPKLQHSRARSLYSTPGNKSPSHFEYSNLQSVLRPSHTIAAQDSTISYLSMFEFCGEIFAKRFLMLNHGDYLTMSSGYLLLSYAYSMALTGRGSTTVLLDLKTQAIRCISKKLKHPNGLLSPWDLTTILALGAPIVCLVSQDLPKRLTIQEYVTASMQDRSICCPEAADTAHRALDERIVHRQALDKLFSRTCAAFCDADSLALLQYVSNCVNIAMAVEATKNAIVDATDLFPAARVLAPQRPIPDGWMSPLTSQWHDENFTTYIDSPEMQLAGLMHKWLATFPSLDKVDDQEVARTQMLLTERNDLRQSIEDLLPTATASSSEMEDMFECCRWASLVLLVVEKWGISIPAAAQIVRIQPRLVTRLRRTDLSNLWGIRKGLLFWVVAVCHIATGPQCFPLLDTALLARFTQEIAMTNNCSEIAIKPLKRLKQFESLCCRSGPNNQAMATDWVSGDGNDLISCLA